MKKYLVVSVLVVLLALFSFPVFAESSLRGGAWGNSYSLGFDDHIIGTERWMGGLGFRLTSGANPLIGKLAFSKTIEAPASPNTAVVPIYLSLGPVLGVGQYVSAGAFMVLGFEHAFNVPALHVEVGIDVMVPNGTGAILEIGYLY